jgi:hypothetical protein
VLQNRHTHTHRSQDTPRTTTLFIGALHRRVAHIPLFRTHTHTRHTRDRCSHTQVTRHSPHSSLLVMHVHVHRTSAIATIRTQSHSVEPLVTPPTIHLLSHRSTSYIPCVFLPSAVDPARGGLTLKGSAMNAPPRARASSNTPLGSLYPPSRPRTPSLGLVHNDETPPFLCAAGSLRSWA